MKKERINYFKEQLIAEKAILEDELQSIGVKDANGDWSAVPEAHTDVEGDEGDQAEFIQDFDSKIARLGSLETKYHQIVAALERIEAGTYGICLKSGAPIEEDRLEANPAAETCKAMMNA
jgi:RNA polymerase-binding transcription factor DksA